MDNSSELDPWANMGNFAPQPGETTPEGLARAAEWTAAMEDASPFNENGLSEDQADKTTSSVYDTPESLSTTDETPERDDNIAGASAILNYGLNAAAGTMGVEKVIQTINGFVPNGREDPIKQLLTELGVDTSTELKDLSDESRAIKPREDTFLSEDINAPTTINKTTEGALKAIEDVRELVAEVQTSPAYAALRAAAMTNGKGIFEYAVSQSETPDLTALFSALREQKDNYKKSLTAQKPSIELVPEDNDNTISDDQDRENPDQEKSNTNEDSENWEPILHDEIAA